MAIDADDAAAATYAATRTAPAADSPAAGGAAPAPERLVAMIPAGQRAVHILPACYSLLEACIEVLATDAAMQDPDIDTIDLEYAAAEGEIFEFTIRPQLLTICCK